MPFKKGDKKPVGSGLKKGQQLKATVEIKEMIRQALDNKGGVKYFEQQAAENPTAFMTLIGKTIPADVKAEIKGGLTIKIVKFGDAE